MPSTMAAKKKSEAQTKTSDPALNKELLHSMLLQRRFEERTAQIAGLRYFNVYGEREQHKGRMASVVLHFFNQYRGTGHVRLFTGSGGYGDGEQRRDFVSVEDCVKVNLFLLDHPGKYLLLCSMSEDEGRHYDLGMIYRFTVE